MSRPKSQTKSKTSKGLTPKQARFVKEYLTDLNATQAAIRCGYSKRTAETQGSRLCRNAQVKAAIARAEAKVSSKLEISAERTLQELARLAYADLGQAYDAEGRLLSVQKMPEDIRRAIAGMEVEALFEGHGEEREQIGTVRKVKTWDKPAALRMLMQHQQLLVERVEHSLDESLEALVLGSLKGGAT